ncbi:hypothetical protein FOZ60_011796 [Perkinsus olseni]|uniref:N-acetyltransferase domain-containing protein n=1 Tax=Perkinsus olseni TaxID=32597 RepID=A0A7J6PLW4_PEROL|nr:hypothetical protein FOZ60_011796 [Perkinsus olseni]
MLLGRWMAEPTNGRTFVAVDPTAERGKAVVGYVDSKKDYVPSVLAALPEKTRLDSIAYISYVFVHPDLRNKRIASTMLPKALNDAVVGYVDFNEVGVLPFYISSQLPGKRSTDTVVHIANVYVVPEMRNKKIGTTMLSKALHDTVAGYVESEEDKPPPAYLEDELPEMTERDTVVYISFVIVHSYVQNKRVASTMLPKALDDIRVRWPTAIAAHLVADRTQTAATKLYNRLNFTVVHRSRQSLFLLYKYPPHNASQ